MRCHAIHRFAVIVLCAVVFPASSFAKQSSQSPRPNVIVESVSPGSEAEKSGMNKGDVLERWSRGEVRGDITSPFDILRLEVEEAPLGNVTLEGRHGSDFHKWQLGQESWGIKVRPEMAGALWDIYSASLPKPDSTSKENLRDRWNKVVTAARTQGGSPQLQSWLWLHAAEVAGDAKDWDSADQLCQNANDSAQQNADYKLAFLKGCADVFMLREKGQTRAEKYLHLALSESQPVSRHRLTTAALLSSLGRIYYGRQELPKAIELLRQALDIQEPLVPGTLALAFNQNRLGVFYQYNGNLDLAKQYLQRSLEIREKLVPDSGVLSTTLENYGNILTINGDLNEAVVYQTRACTMREKLEPETLLLAGCYVDAGTAELDRLNFSKAEEFFRRALAIQKKLAPRGGGAATALNNLGELLRERGQLTDAEECLNEAFSIDEELQPGSLDSASTLSNMGLVYVERGDPEKAETFMQRAVEIREKLAPNTPDTAIAYNALGELALRRGQIEKAKQIYEKSLKVLQASAPDSVEIGDTLFGLGSVAQRNGDLVAAESYHRNALQARTRLIPDSSRYAESLMAIGDIKRRSGDLKTAAELLQQAVNALDSQTSRLGGGEQARAEFRAMFENGYKEYVSILVAQGRPEAAFNVLERLHARSLLETLAAAHVEIQNGDGAPLLAEQRSLEIAISSKSSARVQLLADPQTVAQVPRIEKEIKSLLDRKQLLDSKLRNINPAYSALTQPQPLNISAAQGLLDGKTLLLEYSLGEEHSHVFAVRADSLSVFDIPARSEIEKQSRLVYQLLTERNRFVPEETPAQREKRYSESDRAFSAAAAGLTQMILAPVASLIKTNRLVIVADGPLHYVPFAALPEPASTRTTSPASSQPLALNHEVVTLPSASVLAVVRKQYKDRKPAPNVVAVLADPVFEKSDTRVAIQSPVIVSAKANTDAVGGLAKDTPEQHNLGAALSASLLTRSAGDLGLDRNGQLSLPRLRYTRQEADAIYAVTPHSKALEATDFQATRATAVSPELASYRIVHFATHGLLNSQHPELSGLVFSLVDKTGKSQDGFLTLRDIYNLNLPAELVVLSACETGLGKEVNGEGLIGLTRGFMYAGASRVVASLWNVSDVATAQLMAEFYRSMEKDNLPPAAALRAAQIKMLQQKRWASPYFWAAFQIQGEWK